MNQKPIGKIPVVFVTPTKFGVVNNGPAIYANYLWDSFHQHPDIEFHIVTPESHLTHDQIHVSGCFKSSRKQYEAMQKLGLNVANSNGIQRPAIIHGNTAHTMWMFKKYSGPVIAQVNDYDASNVFDSPVRTLIDYGPRRLASLIWRHVQERRATQFLTKVVCNSDFTRQQVLRNYGIQPPDRATVIYKAVDLDAFTPDRLKCGAIANLIGGRRILFVGCNWHRKGLDCLIESLPLLDDDFKDVTLIVAGAQSQKADRRIRILPEKLGITNRVQFLDKVERTDLAKLYANVDLCALPSRQEALGVAILEALASGKPVIGTNIGGITEILHGCKSAILVQPEKPAQIAAAIQTILSRDKASCHRESIDVAFQFKKDTMTDALASLYSDLASLPVPKHRQSPSEFQ